MVRDTTETVYRFTADDHDVGQRVDLFLTTRMAGWSRRQVQDAISRGAVRVDGHRARKGQPLSAGARVVVDATRLRRQELQPNPTLSLQVLYADAQLVAVDKPPGMPSVALSADDTDTAANFLLAFDPKLREVSPNPFEAGLVHRLDAGTSGVLLAARNPDAYASLRRQFRDRSVLKEYLAIVERDLASSGRRESLLVHSERGGAKMREVDHGGRDSRSAVTFYRPLERFGTQTLVELRIETGVMHQIRVHMATLGHPVVGDAMYGSHVNAPRPLLHASRLVVTHPATAQAVELTSPLPEDFERWLAALRSTKQAAGRSPRAHH